MSVMNCRRFMGSAPARGYSLPRFERVRRPEATCYAITSSALAAVPPTSLMKCRRLLRLPSPDENNISYQNGNRCASQQTVVLDFRNGFGSSAAVTHCRDYVRFAPRSRSTWPNGVGLLGAIFGQTALQQEIAIRSPRRRGPGARAGS